MTISKNNMSQYSRHLWMALGMLVFFIAIFAIYAWAEKEVGYTNKLRQQSFLLSDELRQSSDDLTRMARTYVITGNAIYKQHYQEILDIQNGKKPRPANYQYIYWDIVLDDDLRPRPPGQTIPLLQLLKEAGFTQEECAKLVEAKTHSDALTQIELAAMNLIESTSPPLEENRIKASNMLHDSAFHQAKAKVMRPISQFQKMVDQRTLETIHTAEIRATLMRITVILLGLLLAYLLWKSQRNLHATLGGSVNELHTRIAHLGSGNFSSPILVAKGMENSVLDWLSETQMSLARIDAQRKEAEAKNQRLTKFYSALSKCNQAIVRCTSEAELFAQVCRVVVSFGGMDMAWIGVPDEHGKHIKPIASFGSGVEYLEGLQIPLETHELYGRSPTSSAFRKNTPFWYQDSQHDPITALWHKHGARFVWTSSASLPLHRNGEVAGVLTLYTDVNNAFDENVRNLLVGMAMDIDYALKSLEHEAQRKRAEEALRESEQRLRAIIETEPECIMVVDGVGFIQEMNATGLAMLEADSIESVQEHNLIDFILPEYHDSFMAMHQRVMDGENCIFEFEIEGIKGSRHWLETHAAPLRDANDNITMLLGITRDITARKEAEKRIQYLAHFDALTGLPNRVQLNNHAKYVISLAQRSHESVTLMFLDLDHFKDINDTLGHSVGDALLVELAKRLRLILREEDMVSRLGGDEFIFLLYGVDAHEASHVAQKLLDVIAEPCQIEQYDLNVTGSIGIALYPTDGTDLETLSKSADSAMYRAKQEGRHGYSFFTAEMQIRSARHLTMVSALRQAIERNQLQIFYQPQMSVSDDHIVGAEALLQWVHPVLGSVSPTEFIPSAEESGLILPIGEWVLRHAVRQAKSWMRNGLPPLVMAVNLSVIQFRHPDLPNLITRILEEEGLQPEYLELELTEGVAMNDPQKAIAVMNRLHERGVRMSIDDFGTGFSSLSHLKKFKVYKLKIDQTFVRDISTDPEDRAIVSAIINMAKSLGLQTIAEGVETEGQQTFLREQGCDELQGYYYCKPLSADQFETFARGKTRQPLTQAIY
jgi:diguanylate cyclase (GGDEF)-like protein/PAS domain S-box-containing protein